MTRPPSTLTTSRHPATWGAFSAALAAAVWGLFIPDGQSNVVDLALPDRWSTLYYAALGVGGLCGLVALSIRDQDDRIRAERACWYVIGWFSLLYAAAAFTFAGAAAGQAAILVGAYSPVATARIVQISRERRARHRDLARSLPADPAPLGVADETEGTAS